MYAVNVAKRLRQTLQTSDIVAVTEQLGIIYEILPLPDRVRGFTGRLGNRPYIVVNEELPNTWRRAVAFHELGHIQLHSHLPDQFFIAEHTFFPVGRLENEANIFAAEYLIPDEMLCKYKDISIIAAELDIPIELFRFKRPPESGF